MKEFSTKHAINFGIFHRHVAFLPLFPPLSISFYGPLNFLFRFKSFF